MLFAWFLQSPALPIVSAMALHVALPLGLCLFHFELYGFVLGVLQLSCCDCVVLLFLCLLLCCLVASALAFWLFGWVLFFWLWGCGVFGPACSQPHVPPEAGRPWHNYGFG